MTLHRPDTAAAESLLAFWRDAGVDACFEDAPVDRTHVAPPPAVKAVARATASVTPVAATGDILAEARRLAAGADTPCPPCPRPEWKRWAAPSPASKGVR